MKPSFLQLFLMKNQKKTLAANEAIFYGILSAGSHIYKKNMATVFQYNKINTVSVFKRKKVLQIRPEAEVIKIFFLIDTHK